MIPIKEIIFYVFSAAWVVSALCVILQRNPVRSVLSLVMCFVAAAVLWMLMQAEFLSLVLIFVYVGAVMTLFLFVVMMLNINTAQKDSAFARVLPLGLVVLFVFLGAIAYVLVGQPLPDVLTRLPQLPASANHTVSMGMVLYTDYLLPLELTAVILLVAMLSAIAIAFRGPRTNAKSQRVAEQLRVKAKDRLRIVSMKAEKK